MRLIKRFRSKKELKILKSAKNAIAELLEK